MVDELGDHEHGLDIRHRFLGTRLQEARALGEVRRQHAAAEAAPVDDAFQHGPDARERQAHQAARRAGLVAVHDVDVILQVLADARGVEHHRNAQLAQRFPGPDARQHQHLRRLQRAGRQQHLARGEHLFRGAARIAIFDAYRVQSFHQDAGGARTRDHMQVGPLQVRRDVALGRAAALAVLLRELRQADAFEARAVEVRIPRVAGLRAGLDERARIHAGLHHVGHVERAARAVVLAVAPELVVLGLAEVRQNVGVAPAGVALRGPAVVVAAVAAHVHHPVDRARAAQRLAARLVADAAVHAGIRTRLERPVEDRVRQHDGQAGRALDHCAVVRRAGLEQAHVDVRILGQARGEHAAGRACADDDVVDAIGKRAAHAV